jgi:hypothetical protein
MQVGDKIKIIETIPVTDDNGLRWTYNFIWDGVITQITEAFVETKHARHGITHPYWYKFMRAYMEIYTKHYYHPDNKLSNIIF